MTLYSCIRCGRVSDQRWCEEHRGGGRHGRPGSRQRGYGAEFLRNRQLLLATSPPCATPGCPRLASVADHDPARRVLVARGVENPDALEWLQPLCIPCHNSKAARGE